MAHEHEVARAAVMEDVLAERERQDFMWGDQKTNTDFVWALIAFEELGEVAKDLNDGKLEAAYVEVIQTAAVLFAWAESLRRRGVIEE